MTPKSTKNQQNIKKIKEGQERFWMHFGVILEDFSLKVGTCSPKVRAPWGKGAHLYAHKREK